MQRLLDAGNGVALVGEHTCRRARGFRRFEAGPRFGERGRRVGERALRVGTGGRLAVAGFLGRVLGALARIERVVQGEPVVALVDGLVGAAQRVLGGGELVVRVEVGAGRFGRVDRALGLLDLFLRRFTARGGRREDRGEGCQRRRAGAQTRETSRAHPFKYTCRCSTMKELSVGDRPREKLLRHGAAALGDNELVALVLGQGSRGADALQVANRLLAAHGGAHGLARSTVDELTRSAGIGPARAAQIVAAVELGRRTLARAPHARQRLANPREAAAYLLPQYGARPVEQFGLVLLDSKHRVLQTRVLSSGTLNTSIVEPREVFREAAIGSAAAIVVFHNHPSGDPTPSPEDVELTRRLAAAGVLMGIDLLDHLVLGDVRYYSFKEMGHL